MDAQKVAELYARGGSLPDSEIARLQLVDKSAWTAAIDETYRKQITKSEKDSALFISKREQPQPPAAVTAVSAAEKDAELDTRSRFVTRGDVEEFGQALIAAMSEGVVREIKRQLAPVVARFETHEAAIHESRTAGSIRAGFERMEAVLAAPRVGKRNADGSLTATVMVPPRPPKPPTAEKKLADLEKQVAALSENGMRYRGVWDAAAQFNHGDLVTHDGSAWWCKKSTRSKPGTDPDSWQLMVKRGRDGRDAR